MMMRTKRHHLTKTSVCYELKYNRGFSASNVYETIVVGMMKTAAATSQQPIENVPHAWCLCSWDMRQTDVVTPRLVNCPVVYRTRVIFSSSIYLLDEVKLFQIIFWQHISLGKHTLIILCIIDP